MTKRPTTILARAAAFALVALAGPSHADTERGSETNLPIPRFVSLKAEEGNVRRGPSLSHRIDWVFKRAQMPLIVTDEYGHWRRVEDIEGAGGWMHYSLLSGARTVLIQEDMAALHMKPDAKSPVNARAEAGAVARLGSCTPDWCRIRAQGSRGWIRKAHLWGVNPEEIRE